MQRPGLLNDEKGHKIETGYATELLKIYDYGLLFPAFFELNTQITQSDMKHSFPSAENAFCFE